MATYSEYSKLARVKLPSGTTYALIDFDGRAIIASNFSSSSETNYAVNDYSIYQSDLYKCTSATTGGTWDSTAWELVTVGSELKAIKASISGGVHYKGKTTSSLYDGDTTNPIVIGGSSYTAVSGDLVIETPPTYATSTAYTKGQYVIYSNVIYQITQSITAQSNTSWSVVSKKVAPNEPEFIFDGSTWNELGTLNPQGLGTLAYKNSASGSYVKPTGDGSVTIPTVSSSGKSLTTTTITGTDGTVNASLVSGGTEKEIAKAGTAVVYGTADVGTAVIYGTANRAAVATTVGNADVGTEVVYGTANKASSATTVGNANVGSAVTVATAGTDVVYGNANVGASVTYGNANVASSQTTVGNANVGSSYTCANAGVTATVDGDCLQLTTAGTSTFNGATTSTTKIYGAVASNTTLTPAVAAPNTQKLTPVGGTTSITPAVSSSTTIYGAVDAPSTQKIAPAVGSTKQIYGAETSTSTLTPAVAAPSTQKITPAVSNGKLTGSYTISAVSPAKAASNATTVATGGLETGSDIITSVIVGSTTATVTVGTTTDTVTVS